MINTLEKYGDKKVCIMGLGYVGLTLAVVMAEVGFEVSGIEIRDDVVDLLQSGEPHFFEPRLHGRLKRVISNGSLKIYTNIPEDIDCNVFVITVGTPLGDNNRVKLEAIKNVTQEVSRFIKSGDMVVMRSTVRIGVTREIVKQQLDLVCNNFDLVFCPERTLEGKALEELRVLPQIVGGKNIRARIRAAQMFQYITPTVVQVSDLETAEMIKLIDNSSRDVGFALANEVARLADKIGISAAEVISCGKLGYSRTNLAMPGPVGGPCLEKDSHILVESFKKYDITPEIILTSRLVNEKQHAETVSFMHGFLTAKGINADQPIKIVLAGLAFKGRPATDDLRGTTALPILKALENAFPNADFFGFDAVTSKKDIEFFFDIDVVQTLDEAFEQATLVILANNHPDFGEMPISYLSERMMKPGLIYDYWNNFDCRDLVLGEGVDYRALGAAKVMDN